MMCAHRGTAYAISWHIANILANMPKESLRFLDNEGEDFFDRAFVVQLDFEIDIVPDSFSLSTSGILAKYAPIICF